MMKLVRFKFYANTHERPHTGHLVLSEVEDNKWRMSSLSMLKRESTTLEGDDFLKGGTVFLEELHHFIAHWAVEQADAVEKHRLWSSAKKPAQSLVRKGFRPVTAKQQWDRFKRETTKEVACIKDDYEKAQQDLLAGGWITEADPTPFPSFIWGDPWIALQS